MVALCLPQEPHYFSGGSSQGEFILLCQYDGINVLDKRIIAKKDNIEFIFDEIGELVEEKH